MTYPLKTINITNGVSFNTIIDNRFKTNRISINIVSKLDSETVTINALIPQLLKKGYKGCDNFMLLNRKLEELYGAYVEADVQKRGDYQILMLAITGLDDKFTLKNEELSKDISQILCNMLLNPNVENDGFLPSDVEIEKKALYDTIEAEINEKRLFAINSLIKTMCANEPYGIPKYGYKERIQEITPQSVYKQYQKLINNSRIEIMYTGCGDDEAVINVFKSEFNKIPRDYSETLDVTTHNVSEAVLERTDRFSVNQSKMVLGFATGLKATDMLAPAARLMVAILGGTPSSKLFVNVREKLSLCYYCAARFDIYKGIILVDCGVESENIEKAKHEILVQLDEIKKGNYTDEEMSNAALSLKNAYSHVYENDAAIENFYLGQIFTGINSTPDAEKLKIDSITKQEIIDIANKVQLDTVYILTGNEAK